MKSAMAAQKVDTFPMFAGKEKSPLLLSMWEQKETHPDEMMTPCFFLVCMQYILPLAVKMDTQPKCRVKM